MTALRTDVTSYRSLQSVSTWYCFGFMVFVYMVVQVVSGWFLACYYEGSMSAAFDSLQFVTREVKFAWFTRFLHANLASCLFFVVYIHMSKAMIYGATRAYKEIMWLLGIVILLLLLLVGFSGYSLVWGQMSYWALTVITNLVTVIPIYGGDLLEWIWGNPTLTSLSLRRFYAIHFLVPFVLLALGMVHMMMGHKSVTQHVYALHTTEWDKSSFGYATLMKDTVFMWPWIALTVTLVLLVPNMLMCPDNWLYAQAYVTPVSIEPEWYFLPYYAILRSIPHKLVGFIMFLLGVLMLGVMSLVTTSDVCSPYIHRPILCSFFLNFMYLGVAATLPMGFPYLDCSLLLVWLHFTTPLAML